MLHVAACFTILVLPMQTVPSLFVYKRLGRQVFSFQVINGCSCCGSVCHSSMALQSHPSCS